MSLLDHRIPVVAIALLASTAAFAQAKPERADRPARADKAVPAPAATADALPAAPTDKAELDRTPIIGNRELPKVLYIVPWKKPLPGDLAGKPPVSVVDEALAPIDRDVFRREVRYDALAVPRSPAAATAAKK